LTWRSKTYGGSLVISISSGDLDGSFVGLGTRVAKENLLGITVLTQPIGQGRLLRDVIEVTSVMNSVHLLGNGIIEELVGMSEGASGNSTDAVEVILSVGGIQMASLSVLNGQVVSAKHIIGSDYQLKEVKRAESGQVGLKDTKFQF
jgi:hypothetical protein